MNNILRLILAFLLFFNLNLLFADQIDIGIFESATFPGQIDVKIRPDFDIITPQTITAILYTVRWNDPTVSITTQSFYPFFINPIGQPEEYNGYYYQSFAAVPFSSVNINANQEYLASTFSYTDGDCATFEIIEDEWTQANNGNLYMEFIGTDVSGIIYNPFISFESIGGNITGNDTILLGNSTGPMNLINYQGNVVTWQRKIDDNLWMDIPGTTGLNTFIETPLTIGSYNYRSKVQYGSCAEVYSEILNIQVVPHDEIELSLKVFLEGGFLIDEMGTFLNQQGYIPFNQPYSASPWYYDGSESVTSIPNLDVVDWVLVELRETTGGPSSATIDKRITRKVGFLLNNGSIVDIDGTNNLTFDLVLKNDLYAIVWHRNHLGAMSSSPLVKIGNTHNYDFSSGESQVYGGSSGHKLLESGIWGMIGGDGNGDGVINSTDNINPWAIEAGANGYNLSDYNMNSQSNNIDKNDILNWNYGSASQVPE